MLEKVKKAVEDVQEALNQVKIQLKEAEENGQLETVFGPDTWLNKTLQEEMDRMKKTLNDYQKIISKKENN